MNPSPPLSVVMPVYNAKAYVGQAIESILTQTFTDFEFIIVDDGSADGSNEIIEAYAQRDGRIHVLSQSNQGTSVALNTGIALARGELIAHMGADDIALPQRLERQLHYLRQNPQIGVLGCSCPSIDETGACIPNRSFFPGTGSIFLKWLLHFGTPVPHSTAIVRSELLRRAGGYKPGLLAQDYELWLRLSNNVLFDNLSEPLLLYRRRRHSTTGSRKPQQLHDSSCARQAYLKEVYGLEISLRESMALHTCLTESQAEAIALTRLIQHLWSEFRRRQPAMAASEYLATHKLYLRRLRLVWRNRRQPYGVLQFLKWQDLGWLGLSLSQKPFRKALRKA